MTSNGTHGATMEVMENQQRMQVNLNLKLQTEFQQLKKVPQSYLQLYPGVPGEGDHEEDDDDAWIHEMNETPSERYRRYCQSGQDEVPDPDESPLPCNQGSILHPGCCLYMVLSAMSGQLNT